VGAATRLHAVRTKKKDVAMKDDVPMPLVVVIVLVVVLGLGFIAYRRATPHAPPGARPARELLRESLSKQLGRPAPAYNPKAPD
jgi:hypothetical protein